MSINDFMNNQREGIRNNILPVLRDQFNSHDFIQKFAKLFERNYVEFLHAYQEEAFRIVDSQIAKYLSDHEEYFGIVKTKKVRSKNIFGDFDEIQEWNKI
jgi:hypothetical protein